MKFLLVLIAAAFASGSPVRVIDRTADELKCGICQHLTQDLHNVLSKEDTQTKVVSGLMSRCEGLVEGQSEKCRDIVHGVAPSMLSLLADNVHPYVMCSTLEMCPVEHVEHEEREVEQVDRTTVCEFCQFAINIVEKYLEKNASLPKINETLYGFCNSLPDPLKSECLKFAPAVVKALADGVDPHQACVKAKVCPSETLEHPLPWNAVSCDVCNRVTETMFHEDAGAVCMDLKICLRPTLPAVRQEVHPEPQQEVGAGPGCDLCEFLINTIDQYLQQNKSEAAINATITKFCNELPEPIKDTCNGFAPQLVKLLSQGVDPEQACTKIGLCATRHEPELEPQREEVDEPEQEPQREEVDEPELEPQREEVDEPEQEPEEEEQGIVEDGPGCELCEFLINTIDQYLKENKTEAAINATVTNFCNELPEPLKDTCTGFAPQLIKILAEGVDPKQACTKIGLCSSSQEEHIEEHVEHEEQHEEQHVAAGPGCELCEFLINTIDEYLKQNKSEAAINATITKFCNELPEPLKDTCNGFAPELVKILADGVDPKQACVKIGLCASSSLESMKEKPTTVDREEAGPGCELCEFLINTIDQYLKENRTEAAINATVTKFCNELPEPLKDTCTGFAPQLIAILAEGVDPKQACTKIGLCSTESFGHQVEEASTEPEGQFTCYLCKLLVETLDSYLKNNHSAPAINATLQKICASLPTALQIECKVLTPLLIKELVNGFNASKACTNIKACPKNTEEILTRLARSLTHEVSMVGDVKCSICKDLIGVIDLDVNADEAKTKKQFEDVCHRLPPPTDQKCLDFVVPNFPKIWKEIVDGKLSPENVCKTIKLC
ncbi:uncharacterized protein LOC124277160 isoform X9 [Haliotis rubra]|uniref:uncharacterized protein LOC124277160 isoform X9 n=1 Tax=Haliotis rubra TaxID=36100 RepID=UPI001EE58B2C|nr:uncharacterized protein LOC124277160 isoform X9 [Haliotis rubra]